MINTFIIATDFSEASLDAVVYGLELAHVMKAKVVLFHAFHTSFTVPDAYAPVSADELKQTAEKELKRLVSAYGKADQKDVDCLAVEGDLPNILLTYASRYGGVLLICGMKGKGNRGFALFGSSIMAVIRRSKYPVLAIPQGCKLTSINKIAFATDFGFETDVATLTPLKDLGEKLQAKAIIVRITIHKYNTIEEIHFRSERLNVFLKNLDPQYAFIAEKEVTTGLIKFAEQAKIDMIALISRQHSFFERLFKSSETKAMLYKSSWPLLMLPEIKLQIGAPKKLITQSAK